MLSVLNSILKSSGLW